ncbi:MAG: DUF6250 domain-containing protein [Candidatus Dadabacteria bacterium]
MFRIAGIIGTLLYSTILFGQANNITSKKKLLFSDDFTEPQLNNLWIVETNENILAGVKVTNGKLQLNTNGGITLWYKKKLNGNILIEFDRRIVMEGGVNDRLSDLNQFWMATDPANKMFLRKGGFREYDSLRMYYVGMGGNYNTTTRMRRYDGKGKLQIIKEYTDSAHLLRPNKTYHISISSNNGTSTFCVDGHEFFSFKDPEPFLDGWFAIRSTKSRQLIDNLKIWQLN